MDCAMEYAKGIKGKSATTVNKVTTRGRTSQGHQRGYHRSNYRGRSRGHQSTSTPPSQPRNNKSNDANPTCGQCRLSYPHEGSRENCPAYNVTCHHCGTVGHYVRLCRKREPQPNRGQSIGRGHGRGRGRGYGQSTNCVYNVEASDVNHQENYNTQEEDDYLFRVNSDNRSILKPMFLVNLTESQHVCLVTLVPQLK